MAIDVEQSAILAKVRQRSAGIYERSKTVEAKAGGRQLPGKLKNAIGRATAMKIGESEKGNAYVYLYATCVEPAEHRGLPCGTMFALWEDQWRDMQKNFDELCNALKLIGYAEQIEGADEETFYRSVLPAIIENIEKHKPCFRFNTSNKAKDDGTFRIFIQGLPPAGYVPPPLPDDNGQKATGATRVPQQTAPTAPATAPTAPAPQAPTAQAPAAPSAPKRGRGRPKAPPADPSSQPTAPCAVGERIITTGNYFKTGEEYPGICKDLDFNEQIVIMGFEDSDVTRRVPFANIEKDTEAPTTMPVGTKVKTDPTYFGDGTSYPGTVTAVGDGQYTVKFDINGEEMEVPFDRVSAS